MTNEEFYQIKTKFAELESKLDEIITILLSDEAMQEDYEVLERCHREALERRRQN